MLLTESYKSRLQKLAGVIITEDNIVNFDISNFKKLNSFNSRIAYCEKYLERLSSGSSRIVYKLNDEKVLKLAKNKKGISQNEAEFDASEEQFLEDIVANVFEYDDNFLWIEMELAQKLKKSDFKQITGVEWDLFVKSIHNYDIEVNNTDTFKFNMSQDIIDGLWENEFVRGIFDYMGDFAVPSGDLKKTNSYGVVKRNGENHIVLIDFGLTHDVLKQHY